MQTAKLYYENCHLYDFHATVTDCQKSEKGYLVALDATAFYPEGGGQACDLGTLGNATVSDVQEKADRILHLCDRPLAVGTVVEGKIDRIRRLDLMQQHSGEHIVSGLICKMFDCHNVGFHVGKDVIEIDFDAPIPAEALNRIELLANEAVQKNLPVNCYYPTEAELPTVPYRSKKALPWPVRIVQIPDYDCCACCGVHVERTGEIGLIKLLSCVKLRGGVRIEMVCGQRAVQLMQHIFAQNLLVSQAFSAKITETGAAATKVNEALAQQKLRASTLQTALFQSLATVYDKNGNVCHFQPDLDGMGLRQLSEILAKDRKGCTVVVTNAPGGCNLCIVGTDIQALCAALKENFPTRGGGKNGIFQGSCQGEKEAILTFLRQNL